MAHRGADRVREGRCPLEGHLLRRAPRAAAWTTRRAQSDRRSRHDILVAYLHIVRDQVPFRELGPDWQKKRSSPEHRSRRLQRQIEALGYKVTLEEGEAAEQAA